MNTAAATSIDAIAQRIAMRAASRAAAISRAPRLWPTSAVAAVAKPIPGSNATANVVNSTCCAASAAVPIVATIRTMVVMPTLVTTRSIAVGTPICASSAATFRVGRQPCRPAREMRRRPESRNHSKIAAPVPRPITVPHALPATSSRGRPASPKMST